MFSYRILPLIGCVLVGLPAWAQNTNPAPAATPGASLALLRQIDEGFVQVFEKAAPSVVVIDASKKSGGGDGFSLGPQDDLDSFLRAPDSTPRQAPRSDEGSGIVIRADGMIVTNHHVIAGADKIVAKLKDGRQFPAKLIGDDEQTDVAVLKIEASALPVAPWGDSDKVRVGELVAAIGVPYGQEYSFTVGCVSGKGRIPEVTPLEDYIQTSALINPGNSGGPLLDVEGRVIGMNTLVNGLNRGLAFAIPSNLLKDVSDQLIATGKVAHPALGIRIDTLGADAPLREQIQGVDKGVVITTIEPGTPAYQSDLRPADVITAIDGTPVATARELRAQVLKKKVGQAVALSVWRGGKTLKITVTTGDMSALAGSRTAPERPVASALSEATCGLHLAEVTQAVADRLGLKKTGGALVSAIDPESPAAIAGIQRDDVLTEIDSKAVADASVARKLLESHDGKKALLLFVERKGQKTYAVLKNDQ
jgi:S1-C subfamily serine protease